MIDLNKFIKALELVKPEGLYSVGLVINKSAKKLNWAELKQKQGIKVSGKNEDVDKTMNKTRKALENKKWLVLQIQNELPAKIYAQLRLLSLNNRMQFAKGDEIVDLKLPEESRIILEVKKKTLREIEKQYPEFRSLFGPVLEI